VTVVVPETPPPLPLIVSVKVPLDAFGWVVTVSVDEDVAGFGLNDPCV